MEWRNPSMSDALDAHLALAAGDDAALHLELREAFIASAHHALDLMRRSRCDANWIMAAERLGSLAATFDAAPLIRLAEEALSGAPGDPVALRRIGAMLASLVPDAI